MQYVKISTVSYIVLKHLYNLSLTNFTKIIFLLTFESVRVI